MTATAGLEYTPIHVTIRGVEHEYVYPDTLDWMAQSVYLNALVRYENLRNTIRERPFSAPEAKEMTKVLDIMLTHLLPSLPARARKRLHPGEQHRVVRLFLELENTESRAMVMTSVLSMLRTMSLSASSPESPPSPDSPSTTSEA